MTEVILEARDLVVTRNGSRVLDVPALRLRQGEVLSIIGPNGSGKTTLLLSLAQLLPHSGGAILFRGKPIKGSSGLLAYRRRTATVFQEPLLLDTSVENNVAIGLKLRGMRGDLVRARVAEWLTRFGISHLSKRSARTLSGGESQRASLARAFVLEPEILFLDEPFAALDAPTKVAILEDVERVIRETGVTTVFVTHDRNEALALGDRIGVLMGGTIRQLDTTSEVFQSPATEEVAAFVGVETVAPGVVSGCGDGLARIDIGEMVVEVVGDYPVGQRVLVCLRPEDVTLSTVSDGLGTSARNRLRGLVERLSVSGPLVRVVVNCGFPLVAAVTKQSVADLGLQVGASVEASFKASAVHLIRK